MAKSSSKKTTPKLQVISEGEDEWGRRYLLIGVSGKPMPNFPPILASRLINKKSEVIAELVNAGINLFTSRAQAEFFASIQNWGTKPATFRVATKIGWNGNTYVLPDQIFNPRTDVYAMLNELDPDILAKYTKSKHRLKEWQTQIGKLCLNNSRLMFAIALAFTGPILRFVDGIRSGGFQIYGDPETGKTTAAMVTGSVWGRHRQSELGFLETWNTTANAVEITALGHSDGLLPLDETKKAGADLTKRAATILEATIRLSEQREKRRLNCATAFRSWRGYFLSTSNYSLKRLAEMGGIEVDDADLGRLVDIPLPTAAHGIYQDLHGFASGMELTNKLKVCCRIYYGVAGRIFLAKLARLLQRGKIDAIKQYLQARRDEYLDQLNKQQTGLETPLNRAKDRFATTYAAGALAIKLGVLDWDATSLLKAILSCQLDGLKKSDLDKDNPIQLAKKRAILFCNR